MTQDNDNKKENSQFRKDLVSGEWVLISSIREKRPIVFDEKGKKITVAQICPFDDPQESGNGQPVIWYERPGDDGAVLRAGNFKNWFVQVISNKYPIMKVGHLCAISDKSGPYDVMDGRGYHEVVITKDHGRPFWNMSLGEVELVLKTYQIRYKNLEQDECVEYILIFHNEGRLAGASIEHPHSQIVALPIVPPDVSASVNGALEYFEREKKCAHCVSLEWDLRDEARVVSRNEYFVAVCPHASQVSYEVRIFPLKHCSNFEEMPPETMKCLAEILKDTLLRIRGVLNEPSYNFFIHTSSARVKDVPYYHWHLEILPRTSEWAGVELGTGVKVVSVAPEQAAEKLRNVKI